MIHVPERHFWSNKCEKRADRVVFSTMFQGNEGSRACALPVIPFNVAFTILPLAVVNSTRNCHHGQLVLD